MKTIFVRSSQGKYAIHIGDRLLGKAGQILTAVLQNSRQKKSLPPKIMILSQRNILTRYGREVSRALRKKGMQVFSHMLPEGEKAKSERELSKIYRVLLRHHFERQDVVLALGGGVVGDVAGYAASTYLRGVPFINIGTTLLAQVDSSIGGKTGINLKEGKNLVGAFYPPKAVLSDTAVLKTLPSREYRASLAEVVKYGMIRDPQLFQLLESRSQQILAKERKILNRVVTACARIKAQVVSRDEKETRGERMILNYGHTFGHAFEQAVGYQGILHGEAVSAGMICAARLACLLGLFSEAGFIRQRELLRRLGLPISIKPHRLKVEALCRAMLHDKKRKGGKLRFVLPDRIGHVVIRDDVPMRLVRQVLVEAGGRV